LQRLGEQGSLLPVRANLDHLPQGKRRELEFVVALVREGFAETVRWRTATRLKNGKLLKIVLFGSYARGGWVDDPIGRYHSDYDLLLVVDHEDLTDIPEFWGKVEERLLDELAAGERLRTPVSLIVHTLDDVNAQLARGRYFFVDIWREGVVLFEEPGHPFIEPQVLAPAEARAEAQEYFDEWFESAGRYLETGISHTSKGWTKEAAFELHQAAERYYHCILLVWTLYTPKSHNLNKLRGKAEELAPELAEAWPRNTKFERRCFELLREAYVKARYSRHYKITPEQLAWLVERISVLRGLVDGACRRRLDEVQG
jgi:predicted nucleotidyltransferase/HEPN domain-containing protein